MTAPEHLTADTYIMAPTTKDYSWSRGEKTQEKWTLHTPQLEQTWDQDTVVVAFGSMIKSQHYAYYMTQLILLQDKMPQWMTGIWELAGL